MSAKPPSPSGLYVGDKPVTDWPTIRTWVLKRDGHLCQACKVSAATEVDHIWPRRLGGADHIENLRAICGPCNKSKGARTLLRYATDAQLHVAAQTLEDRIDQIEAELDGVLLEVAGRGFESGDGMWTRLTLNMADNRLMRRMAYINRLSKFAVLREPRVEATGAASVATPEMDF